MTTLNPTESKKEKKKKKNERRMKEESRGRAQECLSDYQQLGLRVNGEGSDGYERA